MLEALRAERDHWWGTDYGEDVHVHRTRTMPKRKDEMEGQGSIYWVIAGVVRADRAAKKSEAPSSSAAAARW